MSSPSPKNRAEMKTLNYQNNIFTMSIAKNSPQSTWPLYYTLKTTINISLPNCTYPKNIPNCHVKSSKISHFYHVCHKQISRNLFCEITKNIKLYLVSPPKRSFLASFLCFLCEKRHVLCHFKFLVQIVKLWYFVWL